MTSSLGLYGRSLSLLNDLYQLTMAYGYWKLGVTHREAVFHLSFRKHPFSGGYSLACGLHSAIDFIRQLRFDPDDLEYLGSLTGNDNKPLFDRGFLDHLRTMAFSCDIDAIPEGTAVFPHEPLIRVRGPILQAQVLETPLLTLLNFQTLVATKAARVCSATGGEPVLEFGLRRAQGVDGGVSASRAAYVGGCAATSNLLAGKLFGIPVRGTHAHSWVMSFGDELEAFESYARAMPNNCVFLVDTYDTLQGVRHAVEVGKRLREHGHEMAGIRLDSGDLAWLSIQARKILDDAGFPKVPIVASNDLDETIIASLKQQGAKIAVWGVGTKLVTAYDQPALGGVYKLAALRDSPADPWQYKVKLSEQRIKISDPGILQVRRYHGPAGFIADAVYNEPTGIAEPATMIDPMDDTRRRTFSRGTPHEDLLVPIFRSGRPVYEVPTIEQVRSRAKEQLAGLDPTIKRFLNPHIYPVGFDRGLNDLKRSLVLAARK
jgi:nicotinate phosphoribosyltransferase